MNYGHVVYVNFYSRRVLAVNSYVLNEEPRNSKKHRIPIKYQLDQEGCSTRITLPTNMTSRGWKDISEIRFKKSRFWNQ